MSKPYKMDNWKTKPIKREFVPFPKQQKVVIKPTHKIIEFMFDMGPTFYNLWAKRLFGKGVTQKTLTRFQYIAKEVGAEI